MTDPSIPDDPIRFHPPNLLIADSYASFSTSLCRYLGCFDFCCRPADD